METTTSFIPLAVLTTTVASAADAQKMAQAAVEQRLAACVQAEAIQSHYVWQEQLECSAEWRLVFKTTPDAQERLHAWVQSAHPYDVPQLLWRTEQANAAYAEWVAGQVQVFTKK